MAVNAKFVVCCATARVLTCSLLATCDEPVEVHLCTTNFGRPVASQSRSGPQAGK